MSDLRDLYQEVILDHHRKPRNFHKPEHANRQADGYNPLCGDKISVFIQVEDGIVEDIGFIGTGCAISKEIFERFHHLVTNHSEPLPDPSAMGKLAVFSGVREYPVRVKCATLAWHTMRAALDGSKETVATE
jgi:nitrogen fixation NifU-like protein